MFGGKNKLRADLGLGPVKHAAVVLHIHLKMFLIFNLLIDFAMSRT